MTTTTLSGSGILTALARDPRYRCPGCGHVSHPCYPGCNPHQRRQQIIQERIAELSSGKSR